MNQLFPVSTVPNKVLAGTALAVVLLHLVLSLLLPQQEWITPAVWIALYAIALAVTLFESTQSAPTARWRWRLIAINFVLAIGGFLCILYGEYIVKSSPQAAWLGDLLRAFRGLPFLLAVCTPEEAERRTNRLLDLLQVLLIAATFLVLFTPGLFRSPIGLEPPQATLFNRYNYTQATLIALLSLLAVITAKTAESRHFHRALAIYLCIGLPINLWTNGILINTWVVLPSSVHFIPSDLCLLAFAFAVPFFRNRVGAKLPSRKLVFLRLGASAFLPLCAVLVSMILATAGHHPVLGILAALLSLTIFGIRSAYGQFQLLNTQWDLQFANQRLENLSQHDPLTSLYNRRWFAESFTIEWKRAQRSGQPLSLLLIDVDHFKLFNDTQGHAAGDTCLQIVSKLLASELRRTTDAIARYGGEEFIIMLPNTDQPGTEQVANRMMQSLAEANIAHAASPFGHVTVSIGGGTWLPTDPGTEETETTPEAIFLFVDAALYEAKNQGRNRIQLGTILTPATR